MTDTAHKPMTLLVAPEECLDEECREYFTEAGDRDPLVDWCSHFRSFEACASCSVEQSSVFFNGTVYEPAVLWADCPHRVA